MVTLRLIFPDFGRVYDNSHNNNDNHDDNNNRGPN